MNRLTVSPGWGPPCPPWERRGGARSISILRASLLRMGSSVQANYLVGFSAFRPTKMVPTLGPPG
jgi:hypothetical protein